MRANSLFLSVVVVAIFLLQPFSYANNFLLNLESLKHADEIKSSDFKAFTEVLDTLDVITLSNYEVEYHALLLAYRDMYQGEIDNALKKIEQILVKSVDFNLNVRARALAVNGLVVSRRYTEAFVYLEYVLNELNLVEDQGIREHILGMAAVVYNQMQQYELALAYSTQLRNEAQSQRALCNAEQTKIEALYHKQSFINFLDDVSAALKVCEAVNEIIFSNIIRAYEIKYYIDSKDFASAFTILDKFLSEVERTKFPLLIAEYYALFSVVYLDFGHVEKSRSFAETALKHASISQYNFPTVTAYHSLYLIAKKQANLDEALRSYELYHRAKAAYDDEKSKQLIAYHLARGEVEIKNQRISLLDKDNELLSLQKNLYAQEVKQNRLIMLLLFSVLVIASFMAYRGMSGRNRFKKIAEYDQLTGISNRYHFNNQARVALNYCEQNAKTVALILFDLDYFKNINDSHGHAAGDWALQQVVKTCRNFMRNNDVFGRIGGEEFAVVLPGCHADKAALLAEICRDAIATIDTSDCGYQFSLSASFGVSSSDTSGYQLKQLLADADLAMYKAKQSGRDQVVTSATG